MIERANPFADLTDTTETPVFQTKPKVAVSSNESNVDQISADQGFPSRKAQPAKPARRPQRRYTTGRNRQINIKATSEVIEQLYTMADARHVPLGELLAQALNALQKASVP